MVTHVHYQPPFANQSIDQVIKEIRLFTVLNIGVNRPGDRCRLYLWFDCHQILISNVFHIGHDFLVGMTKI